MDGNAPGGKHPDLVCSLMGIRDSPHVNGAPEERFF